MQTRTLLKLSLVTLVISLFLLIILSETLEPKTIEISNINEKMLDEWVKVSGQTLNMRNIKTNTSQMTLFEITDGYASIQVVFYNLINLSDKVELIGKVTEYKGKLQIQAKKIKNL